jgi:hypothetical protein
LITAAGPLMRTIGMPTARGGRTRSCGDEIAVPISVVIWNAGSASNINAFSASGSVRMPEIGDPDERHMPGSGCWNCRVPQT